VGIGNWSLRRIGHSRGGRSPRGFVYPLLLLSILIIGITTAAVGEVWSTQMKREKEEELLFRLGELRRGILQYRVDHNRFPKELKDLLVDQSQLQTRRYLRRIYSDPMTGKPDWKLVLMVDPSGTVSGIQDVHSQSKEKSLKLLGGTKDVYQDW
jgi:type II secretory pathway pseudopilin PulG